MAKILTICQPYAHLIAVTREKRVENRTWSTPYRGLIYIHAGKNREWLNLDPTGKFDASYEIPLDRMAFGAVVGVGKLIDCVHIDRVRQADVIAKYPWLPDHAHTNGPWCWIFDENVSAIGPWPWRGNRGLLDIDEEALGRVANQQLGVEEPKK